MHSLQPCYVLLVGGASGTGKTTVTAEIARRLEASSIEADDLKLALERSGVQLPGPDRVATFDGPGGLIALSEAMIPALEAVIENHVDQRNRVVVEGDTILPSLLDRLSVRSRSSNGRVRAVFLHESDPEALYLNMIQRSRGIFTREHAQKHFLHGEWLLQESEARGLPVIESRPWSTLAERILLAAGP